MISFRAAPDLPLKDQLKLFSGLKTFLKSGLPLSAGLAHIREQVSSPRLVRGLELMEREVSGKGVSLTRALRNALPDLPPLFLALVEQGETGGRLEAAVQEVVELLETRLGHRRMVLGSIAYPSFVLVVALLLLPAAELILRGPAAYLAAVMPGLGTLVGLVVAVVVLGPRLELGAAAAMSRDRVLVRAPFLGALMRKLVLARFARSLASLLTSGVAMGRALELAAASTGNRYFQLELHRRLTRIESGATLSDTLADLRHFFPPSFLGMVRTGESAGELPSTLESAARLYDGEAQVALKLALGSVGPLMGLAVTLFVAWKIIGMYMARFDALEALMR